MALQQELEDTKRQLQEEKKRQQQLEAAVAEGGEEEQEEEPPHQDTDSQGEGPLPEFPSTPSPVAPDSSSDGDSSSSPASDSDSESSSDDDDDDAGAGAAALQRKRRRRQKKRSRKIKKRHIEEAYYHQGRVNQLLGQGLVPSSAILPSSLSAGTQIVADPRVFHGRKVHQLKGREEGGPVVKKVECSWCKRLFKNAKAYSKHVARDHLDKGGEHKCPNCSKRFDSKKKFRSHIRGHIIRQGRGSSLTGPDKIPCPTCGGLFSSKNSLAVHKGRFHKVDKEGNLIEGPLAWVCEYCKGSFSTEAHHDTHHRHCPRRPGAKKFPCPFCGTEYSEERELRRHLKQVHKVGKVHHWVQPRKQKD